MSGTITTCKDYFLNICRSIWHKDPQELEKDFFYSLAWENAEEVKPFFPKIPNMTKIQNERGETPLHIVAKRSPVDGKSYENINKIAFALLRAGASAKAQNIWGGTPFSYACNAGNIALVRKLAKAEPEVVELRNTEGSTPLQKVIYLWKFSMARFLIEELGASLTSKDPQGNNTLNTLVNSISVSRYVKWRRIPPKGTRELPEDFQPLLQCIFDRIPKDSLNDYCNNRGENNQTPIQSLIAFQDWEVAKFLLGNGAEISNYEEEEWLYVKEEIDTFFRSHTRFSSILDFFNSIPILQEVRRNNEMTLLHFSIKHGLFDPMWKLLSQMHRKLGSKFCYANNREIGRKRNFPAKFLSILNETEVDGINPLLSCFLKKKYGELKLAKNILALGGKLPNRGWSRLLEEKKTEEELIAIAKLFLQYGDSKLIENRGESLTQLAAREGLDKVKKFCLERKLQLTLENVERQTDLKIAEIRVQHGSKKGKYATSAVKPSP